MPDVSEKLQELQESMQKLHLLKQLGAEKLILEQEQEIFKIQQDIMQLDNNTSIDIIDAVLPKKCKYCEIKTTEEERLDCFERNGSTCKVKVPKSINMLNLSFIKVGVIYLSLLGILFIFLMLTNILFKYFPEDNLIVFGISLAGIILVILLFRKPIKGILQTL